MESGESSPAPSLPKETQMIVGPYVPRNQETKREIDAQSIANREKDAESQSKYLDGLPIVSVGTALGEYTKLAQNLLDGEAQDGLNKDETTDFLGKAFPPELGFNIASQKNEKGALKYIIVKKGQGGLSDTVIVLGNGKHRENEWEFELENQVYLNRGNDRAFDMAKETRLGDYKTYFSIDIGSDEVGGSANDFSGEVEIHITGGKDIPYTSFMSSHEFGHTFQETAALKGEVLLSFVDSYLGLFPRLKPKVFPDLRLQQSYQVAVQHNLKERNADAFSIALIRKLRDYDIRIMDKQGMFKALEDRKVERVESDNYKPTLI